MIAGAAQGLSQFRNSDGLRGISHVTDPLSRAFGETETYNSKTLNCHGSLLRMLLFASACVFASMRSYHPRHAEGGPNPECIKG